MFSGCIVALVTPMTDDGTNVDFDSLRQLVEFHIANGTNGIVVVGTTGEAATLSDEEKKSVISAVVDQVKERIPVIAGTAAHSTQHTIELTRIAMELGADAALIMTPAYIKPTQEGLYLHYKAIAQAVALPQIVYNIPSRTACDILPETIARLAPIANIIGIKEGTGKLNRVVDIHSHCGADLDVYSGDDVTAKDLMLLGGKGVISVTANVAPRLMADMCRYALEKQENLANEIHDKLLPLHQALFVETNPIPVKWAVARLGAIGHGIRLPLTPLSAAYHAQVAQAMQQLGLI